MLLRQLQRPSPRSVVALAAWRPTLIAIAPLHGSSRRQESKPSTPSSPNESEPKTDKDDEEQPINPPPSPTPSLFEKFFPAEARQARLASNPWSSPLFPSFPQTPPTIPTTSDSSDTSDTSETTTTPATPSSDVPLRAKSMLILSAASSTLSEPDFLRLGPQGRHVEGWVNGMSRVIQARDPDTLRGLGHYFILFDSDAAALAYQAEVARLWELAKKHAHSTARGKRWNRVPVPLGLLKDELGMDVAAQIKGFTLVPWSQMYRLWPATGAGRERIADLDVRDMSFVDRLAQRAGTRHLVLVTVDGGRIPVETLRTAIEEDGVERNLPWRVTDLEHGILPFGKSVLKKADKAALDQVGEEGEREVVDDREYRRYPRFIVPFMDSAEAHRFVRGWHRRQFYIRSSVEGEDQEQIWWDETRTLNTSVLW
ncbi:uncharacterized protein GGS22DRAFT_150910 [Annulohypoxylon maeteangense]|uniref:uncharacterized protein n=1 Tax=Annulohypoxylon maeteangense TaxID=1927788 RepID=UPI002007501B|nr:uncharacterized protein GGS22DRAFT_150910 [Annulohypoxylon maeteangense]KAI0890445.1 hypothetical protein GGS22DRAFT_150910 [Annulohypoxylon maeteangense]